MSNYSAIIIKFIPAIVSIEEEAIGDARYFIKIESPRSNRRGYEQHLPDTVILPISTVEPLKLKLMPSSKYFPLGRYRVSYYLKGNSLAILEETWIIPEPQKSCIESIVAKGNSYNLWPQLYSIKRISWEGEWEVRNHILVWKSNPPPEGTEYTIEFVNGYTLDQIVVHE